MGDYTPTTEEVREYVANGGEYQPWTAPDEAVESARTAAFDRWLAQHDREVAAKALREAAVRLRAEADRLANNDPGSVVFADGIYDAVAALRDRADRIERGDDG